MEPKITEKYGKQLRAKTRRNSPWRQSGGRKRVYGGKHFSSRWF